MSLTIGIGFAILRLIMEYLDRFLKAPGDHFFLLGPRGTGKTSWTQHRFPQALRKGLGARRIFLYRGTDRFMRDETLCIPCEDFLKELGPDTLFPE
ncbi:MAG: hypothetical protein ACOCVJ_02995 [Verrucomicrobiota bacterium]